MGAKSKAVLFNRFFLHSFDRGHNLLTTDHGGWAVLDSKELQELQERKPGKRLSSKLEKRGIIVTRKSREKIAERFEKRFGFLFNGTSLHIVNPTMRCNQSCVYCYANATNALGSKEGDLSEETAEKIVDFIFQSPARDITIEFQGGEPLLRFDLVRFMVEKAKEKNAEKGKSILWNVVTNLTLMNDGIAKFLEENRVCLSTSLDGPKEVHEKNRPFTGNGSYEQVLGWIKRLKKDYELGNVGLLPTITRHSLPYAKELVRLYASLGMRDIRPVVLRRIGRAASSWDKIGYSAEQYLCFWKQVVEECIRRTRRGKFMSETTAVLILLKILGKRFPNYTCFSMPCGAGLMQTAYACNGDIYTCDEAKAIGLFRLGSAKKQSYKEVYLSPDALNIVQLSSGFSMPCNECVWHAYCGYCPVTAYAHQGNPVSKLPLDFDCRIKKGQIEYIFKKLLFSKDMGILLQWADKAKI